MPDTSIPTSPRLPESDVTEVLTDEAFEVLPVVYRYASFVPLRNRTSARKGGSPPYRAKGYTCFTRGKPISKCFGPKP